MSLNRRDFLAGSAAAAALAALGRPGLTHALQQQAAQPVFTPIRGGVGFFTMRGGTIGYLVNRSAVVVVDTQFPAEARAFLDGLNAQTGNRRVDLLINTHYHGDHTGGNPVFRGNARKVVAQVKTAEHLKAPPGAEPPADQLFPDTTFTGTWSASVGEGHVYAHYYGPAHTSGDAVITFGNANVAHMGDLMFNQRHPVVDRAAGASLRNWITVLERTVAAHDRRTLYIFGHANTGMPIVGDFSQLEHFRNYLTALLSFVDAQVKAGKSREQILALRDPLPRFESFGRFGAPGPRDPLTVAYEEITSAR